MNALYTIVTGQTCRTLSDLTFPLMEQYADNIGAEFVIADDEVDVSSNFKLMKWMTEYKFKMRELLQKYERVLYVDTDVVILPQSPNLFEIVPKDSFGIFEEGHAAPGNIVVLARYMARYNQILKKNGLAAYSLPILKYYNAGVMLVSQDIFDFPLPEAYSEKWADQNHINYLLASKGVKVFNLPIEFNRMTSWPSATQEALLKSYFVHYSITPSGVREQKIKKLLKDYYEKFGYKYGG